MNFIPAIYFTILTVFLIKDRGIDASSYVSLIFMVTSILAVVIDIMGLDPNLVSNASLLPTIIYCFLLTAFILPATMVNINSCDGLLFQSHKFIRGLNYLFFVTFVGYIVAYFGDLKFVITYGDFNELKRYVYEGDAYKLTEYPKPIELFLYPIRILANASVISLFIFFFNITFLKEKWWLNAMAIIGSTTVIITGILAIDRSKTFFWVLLLGLAVAMFWNQMSAKIKSVAMGFSTVLLVSAAAYAFAVTKDRFEDRDGGSEGGIIVYLGQPYYHFCRIWDYYPAPDGITTKTLLPSVHKFILHDFDSPVAYQEEMGLKSNMDLGVFYTHLGSFMLSAGKVGPFMISIVFLLIFYYVFNESEVKHTVGNKKLRCFPFEKLLIMYFLLSIPTVGCISYYYENYYVEIVTYLLIVVLYTVKDKEMQVITIQK